MPNELFDVHILNAAGKEKAEAIGGLFTLILVNLEQVCPQSRAFSLAKTKLEEACFYAKKAMAQDPANQEPEPIK